MKVKKIINRIISTFAIIFAFGFITCQAIDGLMGFAHIKLPSFRGQYVTEDKVKKVKEEPQHYYNAVTINDLSAKYESVDVAVVCKSEPCNGVQSLWVTVPDKSTSEIKDDGHVTVSTFKADYIIAFKRNSWGPTTATHTGTWYLDETYMK